MSHIRYEIELWKLVTRSKFCKLTCRDELRIAACLPISIDCYRDFQEYVVFLIQGRYQSRIDGESCSY